LEPVLEHLPTLLRGVMLTVFLAVVSFALSVLFAIPLALARLSSIGPIRTLSSAFVIFFISTPILTHLFWLFFVLPQQFDIRLSDVEVVILALTLNGAAVLSEAFRAGLMAVDPGQRDASSVLGLGRVQTLRYVTLPQAVRVVLPLMGSAAISLLKDTSVAGFIGASDLLTLGRLVVAESFRPLEIFTIVALIYFFLTYPISLLTTAAERRWALHR
jgi:His/Glu/Gln/Arg/opine family amino acid ABC transporter permease subunit